MPRKKTVKAELVVHGPKIEEVEAQTTVEAIKEIKPKKHIVMIKVTKRLSNIPVPIEFPVGEIRYWESTDDITYSYEAGYQQYMDSFVNRAIQTAKNTWVPRESTRKWVENLPNAMLIDGYSTSEVLTLDEVE
jgi:hypothetical protein